MKILITTLFMLVSVEGFGQVKFISSTAQAYKNNIRIAERNMTTSIDFYKNVICVTTNKKTKVYRILHRYKKDNILHYIIESKNNIYIKEISYDTKERVIYMSNLINKRTTKFVNLKNI